MVQIDGAMLLSALFHDTLNLGHVGVDTLILTVVCYMFAQKPLSFTVSSPQSQHKLAPVRTYCHHPAAPSHDIDLSLCFLGPVIPPKRTATTSAPESLARPGKSW